jgi:hypothetical protein
VDQALVLQGEAAVEHRGVRALRGGEAVLLRALVVLALDVLDPKLLGEAPPLLLEPLLDQLLGGDGHVRPPGSGDASTGAPSDRPRPADGTL